LALAVEKLGHSTSTGQYAMARTASYAPRKHA
jgi:hypothetical protein